MTNEFLKRSPLSCQHKSPVFWQLTLRKDQQLSRCCLGSMRRGTKSVVQSHKIRVQPTQKCEHTCTRVLPMLKNNMMMTTIATTHWSRESSPLSSPNRKLVKSRHERMRTPPVSLSHLRQLSVNRHLLPLHQIRQLCQLRHLRQQSDLSRILPFSLSPGLPPPGLAPLVITEVTFWDCTERVWRAWASIHRNMTQSMEQTPAKSSVTTRGSGTFHTMVMCTWGPSKPAKARHPSNGSGMDADGRECMADRIHARIPVNAIETLRSQWPYSAISRAAIVRSPSV